VPLIFVSYRRQDTQSATGRLCDKLQEHFGADRVFHDIESIEPGSNFAATIASKIAASSVVLVVIGRHWLDAAGDDGRPRLADPDDYVRLEIATALRRGIPTIPVLVEDAEIPPKSALPTDIAGLAALQAHQIAEHRWQYDSDRLVIQLERFVAVERTLVVEDSSTWGQTLLQSVVAWPFDFVQLLVHPRRRLAALLTRPNVVPGSAVFFTLSHIVAARLFVLDDLVVSVTAFVLTGVPTGAFILLLALIPLHLAARAARVPSHAPTTMVVLAYIQSVAMVLIAAAIALMWTGLILGDPEFGPHLRSAINASLPLDARVARAAGVIQSAIGGPFLATFVLANLIGLYTAGWLVVASQSFRDLWKISLLRAAAILGFLAVVVTVAGALMLFAATL
jgi:hypothetical protein